MLNKMNLVFFTSQQWDFNPILSAMNPIREVVCLGILLIVAESGKLILHRGYMMFFSKVGPVRI